MDLSDGLVTSISTFPESDNVVPSWSHDGQWIYFASNQGGKTFHVWKVPLTGGAPVQVSQGSGFAALESFNGKYVYYAKLSEPGIWRVPRDGGTETSLLAEHGPDNWGNWAVGTDAIYFITSERGDKSRILRLDVRTRRLSQISMLQRPAFYGLTISADAKSIIYSQRDRDEHDVVITRLLP